MKNIKEYLVEGRSFYGTPMTEEELELIKKEFPEWTVKLTAGKGTINMVNDRYNVTVSRPKRLNGNYWVGVYRNVVKYGVRHGRIKFSESELGRSGNLTTIDKTIDVMHKSKYFK